MILESIILPALIPAAVDGIKNLINKFTGSAIPQTIDDTIKLQNADVERLKALAELDRPVGNISIWVADLRASFRYLAAVFIIVGAISAQFMLGATDADLLVKTNLLEAANIVFGFIFGERMYLRMAGRAN